MRDIAVIVVSFAAGILFCLVLGELPSPPPRSQREVVADPPTKLADNSQPPRNSQPPTPKMSETTVACASTPSSFLHSSSFEETEEAKIERAKPPKTGKEWHKQYLKEAGAGLKAFELKVQEVFGESVPLNRKVAMLKTVYETGNPLALPYFELALAGGLNTSPADKEALASFAQRYLAKKSAIDDGAKQLLERNRVANGAISEENEGPEGHPEGLSEE